VIDDLGSDEGVLVPARHAVGDLAASDHDAHLAHLVDEAAERMACLLGLVLVLGVYLDCDWEYFHVVLLDIGCYS